MECRAAVGPHDIQGCYGSAWGYDRALWNRKGKRVILSLSKMSKSAFWSLPTSEKALENYPWLAKSLEGKGALGPHRAQMRTLKTRTSDSNLPGSICRKETTVVPVYPTVSQCALGVSLLCSTCPRLVLAVASRIPSHWFFRRVWKVRLAWPLGNE